MNNPPLPFIIVFTEEGKKPLVLQSRSYNENMLNVWTENPLGALPYETVKSAGSIANKINKSEGKSHASPGYEGLRVMRIGSIAYNLLFSHKITTAYQVLSVNDLESYAQLIKNSPDNMPIVLQHELWRDDSGELQIRPGKPYTR